MKAWLGDNHRGTFMDDLLETIARLEQSPGPVVLATLLRGEGHSGIRRILRSAEGAVGEALAGGRSRVLGPEDGLELDGWRDGLVLLERMMPGQLPPWVHFCGQVLRRGGSCVLATVGTVEGAIPYAAGDRFAYDERNHGLLPMDGRFSLELQRGCLRARAAGASSWERLPLGDGALGMLLEPLP
jgi:hypothetical protein